MYMFRKYKLKPGSPSDPIFLLERPKEIWTIGDKYLSFKVDLWISIFSNFHNIDYNLDGLKDLNMDDMTELHMISLLSDYYEIEHTEYKTFEEATAEIIEYLL